MVGGGESWRANESLCWSVHMSGGAAALVCFQSRSPTSSVAASHTQFRRGTKNLCQTPMTQSFTHPPTAEKESSAVG